MQFYRHHLFPLALPSVTSLLSMMVQSGKYMLKGDWITDYRIDVNSAEALLHMAHDPDACTRESIAAICFDTHAYKHECMYANVDYAKAVELASYHRSTLDGVIDDNEHHEPLAVPNFTFPKPPNFTFNSKRPHADDDIIPLLPFNTDTSIDPQDRPQRRRRKRHLSDQADRIMRRNELRNSLSRDLCNRVSDSHDQLDLNTALDIESGTQYVAGL